MDLPQQSAVYLSKNEGKVRNDNATYDVHSPYIASLLVYPHFDSEEYARRIDELDRLGVTSITLGGRTTIGGKRIAGKGCVGLVMMASIKKNGGSTCALKVRRVDADRKTMQDEAKLHQLANSVQVGPKLLGFSDNFVMMEFINGASIVDWAGQEGITEDQVCRVAFSVLGQCFALDRINLDHGELSSLEHHVITSGDASAIVDFESASTKRKTCNVTSATQSLFLFGAVSKQVSRVMCSKGKGLDREKLLSMLKAYKRDQSRANFDNVLGALAR